VVTIIGSDGFIGHRVKKWAEYLKINHTGVYFEDKEKGNIHFEEYIGSELLKETDTLVIAAGNSNHNLPRHNFTKALKMDLSYLEKLEKAELRADIVFLSSAAVYYGHEGKVDEETSVEPLDYYGLSKLYSEYMVRLIAGKTGKKLIIYRLTNAFGKNEKRKRLFDNIIECIKTGAPLKITGKGESYINPVPVEKVAEILIKSALEIRKALGEKKLEVINLTSKEEVRVIDIVKSIENKYDLKWVFSGQEESPVKFIVKSRKLENFLTRLGIEIEPLNRSIERFLVSYGL